MVVVTQLLVTAISSPAEADPAAARAERDRTGRRAAHRDADDGAHAQDKVATAVVVARARASVPAARAPRSRTDALALDQHTLVAAALVAVLSAPAAVAKVARLRRP